MKKSIFILVLIAFAIQSKAQNTTFGLQTAGFSNKLSFDGEAMEGYGYGGGISANFTLAKKLSLRTEINVQKRNISMTYESKGESTYYKYQETETFKMGLTYIDIPILFNFQTASGLGFYAGPQFGTNLSATYTDEYTYSETDLETGETESGSHSETDDASDLNLSELSFSVGTNYMLKNGLGFDLRAQRSIGVIGDGDWESDLAWTQIQFGLRYNFSLGN